MLKLKIIIALLIMHMSTFAINTFNDTIVIELENNSKVLLVANNIEELKKIENYNLDSLIKEVNNYLIKNELDNMKDTNLVLDFNGEFSNNKQVLPKDTIKANTFDRSNDQILLSGNIGLGLIGNEISPNYELVLGVHYRKYYFSIIGSFNYTFYRNEEGEFKNYCNSFLGAEFGLRERAIKNKPSLFGVYNIGLSYLVRPQGNYFKGNTFKVYSSVNAGKIDILPQFTITDDFKKAYPGVGLRFSF